MYHILIEYFAKKLFLLQEICVKRKRRREQEAIGGERGEGSGVQCGYEETGAMPVVAMVEEKEKTLKIGYVYDASC